VRRDGREVNAIDVLVRIADRLDMAEHASLLPGPATGSSPLAGLVVSMPVVVQQPVL
jgi:hypothetical protein